MREGYTREGDRRERDMREGYTRGGYTREGERRESDRGYRIPEEKVTWDGGGIGGRRTLIVGVRPPPPNQVVEWRLRPYYIASLLLRVFSRLLHGQFRHCWRLYRVVWDSPSGNI